MVRIPCLKTQGTLNRNNRILSSVVRFDPISDRICCVELKGKFFNIIIIIINFYAPTEDKTVGSKNAFYEELDKDYDKLSVGKLKIIIDDFNAKLGKEAAYRLTVGKDSLYSDKDENGNKLICLKLLEIWYLIIIVQCFHKTFTNKLGCHHVDGCGTKLTTEFDQAFSI